MHFGGGLYIAYKDDKKSFRGSATAGVGLWGVGRGSVGVWGVWRCGGVGVWGCGTGGGVTAPAPHTRQRVGQLLSQSAKLDWIMITTEQTEIDNIPNMAEGIFSFAFICKPRETKYT